MFWRWIALAALSFAAGSFGCAVGTPTTSSGDGDADSDTDSDSDTGADTDTDSDTGTGSDTDTGTSTDTDTGSDVYGEACTTSATCPTNAYCGGYYVDEIASECYLGCAGDASLCDGTGFPSCSTATGAPRCLKTASVTASAFTCLIDTGFQTGNNALITVTDYAYSGSGYPLVSCEAVLSGGYWVVQLSAIVVTGPPNVQVDALVIWPSASHAVGNVAGAYVQIHESTYDASSVMTDTWMRGFCDPSNVAVNLTAAPTTSGSLVTGSISFPSTGCFAYNAEFAP
jgi:hypothetical protein